MAGLPGYELGSSEAIPDTREKDVSPTKRRNQYGVVQDYIPDPNDPDNQKPKDTRTRAERRAASAASSYAQSLRRQEVNRGASVEQAKAKLEKMNVATATAFIQAQPDRVRELYLVAEEQGQARRSILSRFPKPGKAARGEPRDTANDLAIAEFKAQKAEARARRTRELSSVVPNQSVAEEAPTEASAEVEAQPEGE